MTEMTREEMIDALLEETADICPSIDLLDDLDALYMRAKERFSLHGFALLAVYQAGQQAQEEHWTA